MATNQTTPLQGWTSSPNGRGTLDILSSSSITLFLCSWSVLCLNIYPPSYSVYKKAWRKFELAGLCFMGPEFIFQLAVGQWCAARRSVAEFDRLKYPGWSMTHAFFANMGGFVLQAQLSPTSEEDFTAFPLDSKQVLYLVENGYVNYSAVGIEKAEIEDKDKVDGVVRLLIVCQIFWYLVCCISRLIQHLDVTVIELATVGFIICSMGTYFFWREKPMDVNRAIVLRPNSTLGEILCEAGESASEPYRRTPMDFVSREEWSWTLYWMYWKGMLRKLGFNFDRTERPIDAIPNDDFPLISGRPMWILFVFQMGYGAVHLTGWSLPFPTPTEKKIWHIATITIMICITLTWVVEVYAWRIPSRLGRIDSGFTAEKAPPPTADIARPARTPSPVPSSSCATGRHKLSDGNEKLKRIAARLRNNTTPHDPVMDVPLRTLIPVTLCGGIYLFARAYVIVEGFINLRALPPSAYESINWTAFLPHF